MKRSHCLFITLAIVTAIVTVTAWEQTDFLAETIHAYRGGPIPPDPLGYFIEWPVLAFSLWTHAAPLQVEVELVMCWLAFAWIVLKLAGVSDWRRFYTLIGPPVLMAAAQGHAILIGASAIAIAALLLTNRKQATIASSLPIVTAVAIRADLIVLLPLVVLYAPSWRDAAQRCLLVAGGMAIALAIVLYAPIPFDTLGGSVVAVGHVTSPASLWTFDQVVPIAWAHVGIVAQLLVMAIAMRVSGASLWTTAIVISIFRAVLDPWFVVYYLTPAWMVLIIAVTQWKRRCDDGSFSIGEHNLAMLEGRRLV
jgi:hypothetical protein